MVAQLGEYTKDHLYQSGFSRDTEPIGYVYREKERFILRNLLCSINVDVHLIPKITLTDTPRINFDHLSGHGGPARLTQNTVHHTAESKLSERLVEYVSYMPIKLLLTRSLAGSPHSGLYHSSERARNTQQSFGRRCWAHTKRAHGIRTWCDPGWLRKAPGGHRSSRKAHLSAGPAREVPRPC